MIKYDNLAYIKHDNNLIYKRNIALHKWNVSAEKNIFPLGKIK